MMKLKVLVQPEVDGGYSVSLPAMPGCHSQGDNLPEALDNIREAAELWLETVAESAAVKAREENANSDLQEIEL